MPAATHCSTILILPDQAAKILAALLQEAAQAGNKHFTPHHDDGHPRRDAAGGNRGEVNERAADDELVGERIEDPPELRGPIPSGERSSRRAIGRVARDANKTNARARTSRSSSLDEQDDRQASRDAVNWFGSVQTRGGVVCVGPSMASVIIGSYRLAQVVVSAQRAANRANYTAFAGRGPDQIVTSGRHDFRLHKLPGFQFLSRHIDHAVDVGRIRVRPADPNVAFSLDRHVE